ncbi:hypothetical protein [Corallococcus sp. EGB]|uniref:hypothetical protein n=1 Tax=Corallococcus sp. EGB TaxID=1521117 RepID=UPI001CC1766D|nr:hypothetical protein [Corallococcus sp. EGB]
MSATADGELPSDEGQAEEAPQEEQRLPPRNPGLFERKPAPSPAPVTEASAEVLPPEEDEEAAPPPPRASATAKKTGRPVGDDPKRRERTYKDKLKACRVAADFRTANEWALKYGVPIPPYAQQVERQEFGTVGGQPFVKREPVAKAQARPAPGAPAPAAQASGAAAPGAPAPAAQAPAAAPPPPPPPPEPPKYMGQDFQRVRKFAEAALPFASVLGEVSKRFGVDVSQPTRRKLFAGTQFEGQYEGDPVARMAELAGVIMAKRAPSDADGGMPAEVELLGVAGLVLVPAAPIIASKAGDFLTALAVRVTGVAQRVSGFIRSRRR